MDETVLSTDPALQERIAQGCAVAKTHTPWLKLGTVSRLAAASHHFMCWRCRTRGGVMIELKFVNPGDEDNPNAGYLYCCADLEACELRRATLAPKEEP